MALTPTNTMSQKILFIDIETFANLGYTWGKYEQDVIHFEKEWYVLSFAYKWLGDKNVRVLSLPDYANYSKDKENDIELIKDIWKLLDEADIVIGQNSDNFDLKKLNTRFAIHGLGPPAPYRTVDTLKVAKKYFGFNSNKLDALGKSLGLGEKLATGGFGLWLGCKNGDTKAWAKMCKYNKMDVVLLEKVYLKLRPWMTNHPRVGDLAACNTCGSNKVQKRGFNYTRKGRYQRYACLDCGAWGQE